MPDSERRPPPLVADAIPPNLRRRGISQRRVFVLCLIGAAVLALFASRDTPGWAERLGDSPLDHALRGAAGAWDEAMEAIGFTRPHDALRDAMRRALDRQWDD